MQATEKAPISHMPPPAHEQARGGGDYESEIRSAAAIGHRRLARRILTAALAAAGVWSVYALARSGWYEPGDDIGYNLGLVGALAMLVLLFYPARKRIGMFSRFGRLNRWFSLHMVLGIAGPVLILLHCTLRWSSLNAAVAFWCMAIVASSGFIGRYLYARLHVGLYGRQLSLTEVRMMSATLRRKLDARLQSEAMAECRPVIQQYTADATGVAVSGWKRPLAMLMLSSRAARTRRRCRRIRREAVAAGRPAPAAEEMDLVDDCILAAQRSAQFLPLERLFSLWHVLHLPLVFIMVLSVIAHIIAVHMY